LVQESKKVLVVDDAMFMRVRCQKLLSENGYLVFEAENGEQAVKEYPEISPDVVLMDITMPVMDGLTALTEILKNDPNAKVIMCTALGQQSVALEAIKSGAIDFVTKPYKPDKLLRAIELAIQDKGE
jgi:two-component system chemotaxis response regulator CheY